MRLLHAPTDAISASFVGKSGFYLVTLATNVNLNLVRGFILGYLLEFVGKSLLLCAGGRQIVASKPKKTRFVSASWPWGTSTLRLIKFDGTLAQPTQKSKNFDLAWRKLADFGGIRKNWAPSFILHVVAHKG